VTHERLQGLDASRAEIDRIDDNILELIERRLAVSLDIAARKETDGDLHLKVRPRRQREILERLQAHARRATPELVDQVWREIMAHSLQSQARTELVLAPSGQPELLEARVRAHFGSAAPIRWAASTPHAIRSALVGEAIAVIPEPLAAPEGELRMFDVLTAEDGQPIAYAVGRLAAADVTLDPPAPALAKACAGPVEWSPESWRARPAQQLANYPDAGALARVERRLVGSESLVGIADIIHLRAALAAVANGEAFIVQGGDCAESFAEFNADKVRVTYNLLLRMGAMLRAAWGGEVVHLARIAGQFAKPRSSPTETIGEVTLPSYRGDAVNAPAFTASARTPDPKRLLEAHRQAQVTVQLLDAYAAASYADLPTVHRDVGLKEPVGLKCGPGLEVDDLLRLMDRLDPEDAPGRLVLIGRFGASKIGDHLPKLMRATRSARRRAIWSIDPMHGNTSTVDGLKTRMVPDIVSEVQTFFEVAAGEGVHPGGVHLEMTGSDVTECIGGSLNLAREDLGRSYLTHCDPRLNEGQALDVAHAVAALLAKRAGRRANAA